MTRLFVTPLTYLRWQQYVWGSAELLWDSQGVRAVCLLAYVATSQHAVQWFAGSRLTHMPACTINVLSLQSSWACTRGERICSAGHTAAFSMAGVG